MKRWLLAVYLIGSTLSSWATAENGFAMDPQTQERLGVETHAATSMRYIAEAEGSGTPIDLVPLLTLDADLVAAEAALSASSANFERTATLHADRDNASALALETARAQMLSDRAHRDALIRQLRLIGGDALAASDQAARQSLLDRLSSGAAVLLRADFSPGTLLSALSEPSTVRIVAIDGEKTTLNAKVLERTTSANPQRPGPGLLVLAETPEWLQPGRSVRVIAPTRAKPATGVLIPATAVLRREGAIWCYVKVTADRFERRRLSDAVPVPEGLFVAANIRAGEALVVHGAASLLAAEIAGTGPAASGDSDD